MHITTKNGSTIVKKNLLSDYLSFRELTRNYHSNGLTISTDTVSGPTPPHFSKESIEACFITDGFGFIYADGKIIMVEKNDVLEIPQGIINHIIPFPVVTYKKFFKEGDQAMLDERGPDVDYDPKQHLDSLYTLYLLRLGFIPINLFVKIASMESLDKMMSHLENKRLHRAYASPDALSIAEMCDRLTIYN